MEPKILSSGEFSPDDLSISISPSNRMIDKKIEDEIEKVWKRMMMRAKEKGLNLYNGISYRLNSLEQKGKILKIDFSTFEYKVRDGLVALNVTSDELIKRYSLSKMDIDIKSIKFFRRDEYLEILRNHNPNKQLIARLVGI